VAATMARVSPRAVGIVAAAVALAADQAHKFWMLNFFDIEARQPLHVTTFLDIVLSWNRGVSYSLFAADGDTGRYVLLAGQVAIICAIVFWFARARERWTALALGLVVGGALGNAGDRLFRGAVADFFYLHTQLPVGPLANYVFNVADAFITLGVALLLTRQVFAPEDEAN